MIKARPIKINGGAEPKKIPALIDKRNEDEAREVNDLNAVRSENVVKVVNAVPTVNEAKPDSGASEILRADKEANECATNRIVHVANEEAKVDHFEMKGGVVIPAEAKVDVGISGSQCEVRGNDVIAFNVVEVQEGIK